MDFSVSCADSFFFVLHHHLYRVFALSDALAPVNLDLAEFRRQHCHWPPLEQQRDEVDYDGAPREPGKGPELCMQILQGPSPRPRVLKEGVRTPAIDNSSISGPFFFRLAISTRMTIINSMLLDPISCETII